VTTETTDTARRGTFVRRNLWLLLTAAALVLALISAGLIWSERTRVLSVQDQKIADLDTQISQIETAEAEQVDADILEALGVSRSRLTKDGRIINMLLDTAFTWDSGLAFEDARNSLKDRYGLTEEDPFLIDFMPPSRFNEDADGNRYYYIDTTGVNSEMGDDPEIEVVSVTADAYRYVVLADVRITADAVKQEGGAEVPSTNQAMLLYVTINAEGQISDLSGAPASGSTRLSG
jgi:hypothetical protein